MYVVIMWANQCAEPFSCGEIFYAGLLASSRTTL